MATAGDPSADGSEPSDNETVNWKERCQVLETSLIRFRQQVSKIKEVLSEKIQELEARVLDAERRAVEAESRMRSKAHMCDVEVQTEANVYAQPVLTDDSGDSGLRASLYVDLTQAGLPMVEAAIDNDDALDAKLMTSSMTEGIRSEREAEMIRSEREVRMLESARVRCEMVELSPDTEENIAIMEDAMNSDYHEVDANHESKYEPLSRRLVLPQIHIERKVFQSPHHSSSVTSSGCLSEEMLATKVQLAEWSTKLSMERQPGGGLVGSGKTPTTPVTPIHTYVPPNSPHHQFAKDVPEGVVLPRRQINARQFFDADTDSDLVQEMGGLERDNLSSVKVKDGQRCDSEPPPIPIRRLSSLEHRLVAMSDVGFRLPDLAVVADITDSKTSLPLSDGQFKSNVLSEITAPVYTILKGRAVQILSSPIVVESSSDSDDTATEMGSRLQHQSMYSDNNSMAVEGTVSNGQEVFSEPRLPHRRHSASSQSLSSEASSDYVVPPEDVSIATSDTEMLEPRQKVLRLTSAVMDLTSPSTPLSPLPPTSPSHAVLPPVPHRMSSAAYTPPASPSHKGGVELTGYLMKMSRRLHSWRQLWCVLKGAQLFYYSSENDVAKKPRGYIILDSSCKVIRTDSRLFQVQTSKQIYTFTAPSDEQAGTWVKAMSVAVKRLTSEQVLCQGHIKESIKGWLTKSKCGVLRRLWCVLIGRFLLYFKNSEDKTPIGQLSLRGCKVEEVSEQVEEDEEEEDEEGGDNVRFVISITPPDHPPTYLRVDSKFELNTWLYHLTVAAGAGPCRLGTEFEQLVQRLMDVDGARDCPCWKSLTLLHSKELIKSPLTTLPSLELQHLASEIAKMVQGFMTTPIDSQHTEFHVNLAQSILDICLQHTPLQDELFCLLIKQTSRHPSHRKSGNLLCGGRHNWFACEATATSPSASLIDLSDNKLNPAMPVLLQGWQLLAMAIPIFLPRQSILWLLRAHLTRNSDLRHTTGEYAMFCKRALEWSLHQGGREARPSRLEVISILLRNPYHHSLPISIPVHFINSTYQVVSFDGSTTVHEFVQSLCKDIGVREYRLTGFALYSDDPTGRTDLEYCLSGHLKVCDVISRWEQAYLSHCARFNRQLVNKTIRLTYKNRLYMKDCQTGETDRERLLLAYQFMEELVNGRFPLAEELALEMAALMAQVEYGDQNYGASDVNSVSASDEFPASTQHSSEALLTLTVERFFPRLYRRIGVQDVRSVKMRVACRWASLRGHNPHECVKLLLAVARQWPYFGARLFYAKVKEGARRGHLIWLAVCENCIVTMEYGTLAVVETFPYKAVMTFGGCGADFMLVVMVKSSVVHTRRLLFIMSKQKTVEIVDMLVSYINHHRQPAVSGQSNSELALVRTPQHVPVSSAASSSH